MIELSKCRVSVLAALHTILRMLENDEQDDVVLLCVSDPLAVSAINQYNDDLHDDDAFAQYNIQAGLVNFIDKLAGRSFITDSSTAVTAKRMVIQSLPDKKELINAYKKIRGTEDAEQQKS